VTVAQVIGDFAFNDRICYRVVLSCGCRFWEYLPVEVLSRRKCDAAMCYADHARHSPRDPDADDPSSRV
jgi:hypothetical protein